MCLCYPIGHCYHLYLQVLLSYCTALSLHWLLALHLEPHSLPVGSVDLVSDLHLWSLVSQSLITTDGPLVRPHPTMSMCTAVHTAVVRTVQAYLISAATSPRNLPRQACTHKPAQPACRTRSQFTTAPVFQICRQLVQTEVLTSECSSPSKFRHTSPARHKPNKPATAKQLRYRGLPHHLPELLRGTSDTDGQALPPSGLCLCSTISWQRRTVKCEPSSEAASTQCST